MTDTNDRYVKTGIFLAPFHDMTENPILALERDIARDKQHDGAGDQADDLRPRHHQALT